MKKDGIAYTVLFTFVACAVFIVPLAFANELTKGAVAANRLFASHSAVLDAFGIPYSGAADVEAKYATVRELEEGAWSIESGGSTLYAAAGRGPGLWGTIEIVVAADPASGRVVGVRVLSHNETPGLGGRIEEEPFLSQYRGERYEAGGVEIRTGAEASGGLDADPDNSTIDGVSGASRSSQALKSIVNAALVRISELAGGGR
jgi:Na+-transporting NADH:ubiquinone oxidoreductase subunit C